MEKLYLLEKAKNFLDNDKTYVPTYEVYTEEAMQKKKLEIISNIEQTRKEAINALEHILDKIPDIYATARKAFCLGEPAYCISIENAPLEIYGLAASCNCICIECKNGYVYMYSSTKACANLHQRILANKMPVDWNSSDNLYRFTQVEIVE